MNIEEQLLAAAIRNTIQEANRAVSKLSTLMDYNTLDNIDAGEHAEEVDEANEHVRYLVEKVFRDTAILWHL